LSSVAVLAGLLMMRPAELFPSPQLERAKGQLRAGVRYVLGRRDLLLTMVLVFVVGTFGLNFQITTALLAKQVFHRSASGYGLLSTALAVGACAGAVLATRRTRRPSSLFLVGSATAFGLIEVAAGSMPGFLSTAALLLPAGLAMLTFTTAANSSVQLGVEPTMRGRVMALYLMCFMGGTPFGAPLIGWTAGVFGPRWGMIGGGLISAGAAIALGGLIAHRRRLSIADVLGRGRRLAVRAGSASAGNAVAGDASAGSAVAGRASAALPGPDDQILPRGAVLPEGKRLAVGHANPARHGRHAPRRTRSPATCREPDGVPRRS
jgi:MFS family permease